MMTTRDTDLAVNATSTLRRNRAALYLTSAIIAAIPTAGQATIAPATSGATTTIAVTTPTPAAADTVAALNAAITTAAGTAGVTDLVVNIGNAVGNSPVGSATITASNTLTLTKSITLSNTAALGTVGTDTVNIQLNGAGSPGGAANTATISNSGLVNGSVEAYNFGGNVAISNTGTANVTGYVQATGFGNVTYVQDAGVTVGGSYVAFDSLLASKSVTNAGVTTDTNSNGNVTVTINGPAASATVNSVSGDVYAGYGTAASGAAKAVINGTVGGTVFANAGGFQNSLVVTTPAASVAGKDTVTNLVVTTGSTAAADVSIGATGRAGAITARAAKGGSVVKISGTVNNNVNSSATAIDSVATTTTTADAANVATKIVTVTTNTFTGGASTVTVDKGAIVGRLFVPAVGITPAVTLLTSAVSSSSDTASTVNVDGTVTGNISSIATPGANTTTTTTTVPPGAPTTVTVNSGFNASTAAVNIGATGVAGDAATGASTSVTAAGYSSANIVVATGGKMYSTASATGTANLTSSTATTTSVTNAGVTATTAVTNNSVQKGGTATITNGSAVQSGSLTATGTTAATVTNTGKSGALVARATTFNQTTTLTDSDSTNVDGKTRVVVNTVVTTANAGVATITNSGAANGSATLQGSGAAASTLSNTGTINGNINVGASLIDRTVTTTWAGTATTPLAGTTAAVTAGAPTTLPTTTANKTLAVQNYVINQNGAVNGNINVTGTTNSGVTNSVVNATVNLGTAATSVNLGGIIAEQAAITPESITNVNPGLNGQANLTNTRVNLGVGFLGADFVGTDRTPVIAKDATSIIGTLTANGTPNIGARILGVNSVTKTGAGTFVIAGSGTTDAAMGFKGSATAVTTGTGLTTTAGAPPLATGLTSNPYTIDLGGVSDATANTPQTTNLLTVASGGELQLTVVGNGTTPVFGIRGDIKNDGTLVLGRRMNPAQPATNVGAIVPTEVIRGITVSQNGNFTQGATGTLVVGIVPQLQGTGGNFLTTNGSGATSLAPVVSGLTANTFAATSPCTAFGTAATAANCTTSSPSLLNVKGNLSIAGTVVVDGTPNAIYVNGDKQVIANYSGTGDTSAAKVSVPNSKYVNFTLDNNATTKQITLAVARKGYETTANANPNAASAALGFNNALTAAIATIKAPFGVTATNYGNAQDVANIASQLDWTLSNAQAVQVFNEMSSAEIYSSLAALDQNAGFGQSLDILTERRSAGTSRGAMALGAGEGVGARLWLNPTAQFAKYGDTNSAGLGSSGQSQLKANTYGGAMGLDISFSDTGAFGFGVGYAKHDLTNVGTPENGDGSTVTLGAYVTQGFGPIYANLKVAYGFSKFDVTRNMALLARTAKSSFKGNQFDAALQVGYDLVSGSATITPFAELAIRHWKLNGFTETGAAGIGLSSADRSKSVFNPTLGVKFVANTGDPDGFSLRPFGKLAYTFQGDIGNLRNYTYAAGGSFGLAGVNPKGYGTAELGLDATLSNSVGMWLGGSYDFGGRNKVGAIKAGMDFMFGGGRHVEAAPPPPPPMPVAPAPAPMVVAPAPAPAPVCNKGPYIVFFDWDKSDITAEASTILDSAVSAYGNCSRVPVMVAGYADRSGSPKYNQGLSERRASNIRGYLSSRGISDSAISTQGFGENNNRVPTADGVKELQNRRVEISYGPGSGN